MNMDRNNTTTYITAKNSMGCNAPNELEDLDLMTGGFSFSKIGFALLPESGINGTKNIE